MLKKYEYYPLNWDTNYFGVKSAKVNLFNDVDKNCQDDIINFVNKYEFVTFSNLDNNQHNNYWIGHRTKSFLVDTNIQFIKDVEERDFNNKNIIINRGQPNEKKILEIASSVYTNSRFLNDPNLNVEKSVNIYKEWTKNAFNKDDKYFIIYQNTNEIGGYLLFSFQKDACIIELFAVDKEYQGKGIGTILLAALEAHLFKRNVKTVRVGTQLNNINAINFYIKNGFYFSHSKSIYHLWNNQ